MAVFGLATIALVGSVPLLRTDWAGIAFGLVVAAGSVATVWWKARHPVRPVSRRHAQTWVVAWVVLYEGAVSWFGPSYLDRTVGWWSLMGVVVAVPAFAEAGRVWRWVRP